jgi:hypothetical protein
MLPSRPDWSRKRPAPRRAAGPPRPITDTVTWTRIVEPRERYRILYLDRENTRGERDIDLQKIGISQGEVYLGVWHEGRFKTLRADRVLAVEQLSTGHAPSIQAAPTYALQLPAFPVEGAVYKIPTTSASNRTWTVDLNRYTCSCPEKRIRGGMGYAPGQLGFVCDHMAKAILGHLPEGAATWSIELRSFLANPRKVHIDNLTPMRSQNY